MTHHPTDRLIIALDVASGREALRLARLLAPVTRFFKIGSVLFTLEGPPLVEKLVGEGFQIFLDLKFHDIPEVVVGSVMNAAKLGISMMTLHASGGESMMRAGAEAARRLAPPVRPLLLGVTVLTSFSQDSWGRTFPGGETGPSTRHLADLAASAGLDGVVCSPQELPLLSGVRLKKIVPGVRPAGSAPGDQQRIRTPAQAIGAGADYLVVGRPITQAPDPVEAARQILLEMGT